jgi:hypothetical protein
MQDFFAAFFEFFGTVTCTAYEDLFEFVYIPAGFLWIGLTALWTLLYYQGFIVWRRRAKYDTRLSWIIWMLLSSLLTTLSIWILTISKLKNEELDYGLADYLEFLCLSFFWSMILYLLYSILFRFSNPSRKKIPF